MSVAKVIAIVVGGLLALAILLAGAGYYWWRTQVPKLKAQADATKLEASGFGDATDNLGCLEESLGRYDLCEGRFNCNVINNTFFLHCLRASSATVGFCEGVPKTDSISETVAWRLDQCQKHGRTGTHCGNLFGQIQDYCESLAPDPGA